MMRRFTVNGAHSTTRTTIRYTASNTAAPKKYSIASLSSKEKLVVCGVFAITGSSAVLLVKPTLKVIVDSGALGLPQDSGFIAGPWQYRVLYFSVMWPSYSVLLWMFGTLFGRREFFSFFVCKMWGRFLPKRVSNSMKRAMGVEAM